MATILYSIVGNNKEMEILWGYTCLIRIQWYVYTKVFNYLVVYNIINNILQYTNTIIGI